MTDFRYNADNILCNFPSCLRKNIEELCLRSQIGLGSISLQDISILSDGRYNSQENALPNYHYILRIPYAGKQLKWEVIFDPEDFYFAPDFDFNDDQFLNDFNYEMFTNNVPSLIKWNLKNPKAITHVLNELLSLYKKLQVEKLLQENIYSRFCDEYQLLVSEEHGVKSENVEVCIESTSVHFLISLQIDCSSLPEYIQPTEECSSIWFNPGEDYAHLKISVLKLDGTRSNIALQLSPRLEQVLGSSRTITLPDYKKDTSLIEYVSKVALVIDGRIELVVNHYKMKKIYIMSLAATWYRYIVEYDTETFNKAVLLYNVDDYNCLVTITIGSKFPQEKPSVHLSSIYCQEGRQCNENVDKYPYNSNLRPDDNIEVLFGYLKEVIPKFKNHKH